MNEKKEFGPREQQEREMLAAEDGDARDDGGVEQIPDGNRFKPVVETLRDAGWSYERIWEEIEDAYNPIDRASLLETSPDDGGTYRTELSEEQLRFVREAVDKKLSSSDISEQDMAVEVLEILPEPKSASWRRSA